MNTKQIILIVVCAFLTTQTGEAQIFKKIKEKINQVSGNTQSNETNSQNTDSTANNAPTAEEQQAANIRMGNIFGGGLQEIRDSYTFSYSLVYQITTNKESMALEYLLEPEADYFANQMNEQQGNQLMVYDFKKNAMVTFMDNDGQKMAMKMKMPSMKKMEKKFGKKILPDDDEEGYEIVPIESKTILGYNCDGYQVTSKDGVGRFWVTNEAPVTINEVYANFKSLPKKARNYPLTVNSLILEMNYSPNRGKKDTMEMVCTKLTEKDFEIRKEDYQSGF